MNEVLMDIGSVIAIISLAVSVFTLYLGYRKTKKDLELAKKYLHTLSELVKTYRMGLKSQQQLRKNLNCVDWKVLEKRWDGQSNILGKSRID